LYLRRVGTKRITTAKKLLLAFASELFHLKTISTEHCFEDLTSIFCVATWSARAQQQNFQYHNLQVGKLVSATHPRFDAIAHHFVKRERATLAHLPNLQIDQPAN
jgi:hypothetical protein